MFMSMGLLISGLISWGMSAVTAAAPHIIAAIAIEVAIEAGKAIVKAATPDELEKGWLIIGFCFADFSHFRSTLCFNNY